MKRKKIIMLAMLVNVFGCSLTGEEIKKAEGLCEVNGGLVVIDLLVSGDQVTCKNGARFDI